MHKVSNTLFIPMLIAFILSFIGDLGLGYAHIKKNKLTQGIGFIGFSLAQVVFIYSFISNFGFKLYLLFIPIIGVLMGQYFVYKLNIKNKGIYLLAFIYMSLVTMMFSSSLSAFINLQNKFSIILLIGGITFAISDYTLLFKYYDQKHKNIFTIISVLTYGVAQLLLATSILFY